MQIVITVVTPILSFVFAPQFCVVLLNFVLWTLFPPFFRIAFPLVHVCSFENCITLLSGHLSILSKLTLEQKYGGILSTHEDTIL